MPLTIWADVAPARERIAMIEIIIKESAAEEEEAGAGSKKIILRWRMTVYQRANCAAKGKGRWRCVECELSYER
jgi:hypothetical protein